MSTDIALTGHVASVVQASKNDTNKKFLAFNEAVTGTFSDMDAAKANKSEITEILDFIKLMRLYVDEDGDYAQKDTIEEEEQDVSTA